MHDVTSCAIQSRFLFRAIFCRRDTVTSVAQRSLNFSIFLAPLSLILCLIFFPLFAKASPQSDAPVASQGSEAQSDLIVLVVPQTATQATIALVYSRPIPEARVHHEINLLVKTSGGTLGKDLEIETKSVMPKSEKVFPRRTGATFTLLNMTQLHDNAPVLAPYLTAFQAWDHVEVIFSLPDLTPYNGLEKFEDPALTIQMIKDPGVYRYEADIRNHNSPLPSLIAERKAVVPSSNSLTGISVPTAGGMEKTAPTSFPLVLLLAGGALVGGACAYLALSRRSHVGVVPPNMRR